AGGRSGFHGGLRRGFRSPPQGSVSCHRGAAWTRLRRHRLRRNSRRETADLRSGQRHDRACHGSGRHVPLQAAGDAQIVRRLPRDACQDSGFPFRLTEHFMGAAELTTPISLADEPASFALSRDFGLPPIERLLLEGGDARIALTDGASNRYGCTPRPDPDMLAFGSSTASTISSAGFEAASALHRKLFAVMRTEASHVTYAREIDRIRGELGYLCGIDGLPGIEVIFAASGTDLHLIAAQLAAGTDDSDTLVIMVDGEETGKGVPVAVSGKHFNARTALGASVAEGTPIAESAGI